MDTDELSHGGKRPGAGRPAETKSGKPRKHMLTVRLCEEELEALDALRGDTSRGEFVRQLIRLASAEAS